MSKYLKWFAGITASLIILGFSAISILYLLVSSGFYGKIPDETSLSSIQNLQATEILDQNNQIISKVYIQDRSSIPYEKISPQIIKTLVAVEDKRFYDHQGVDYRSLIRVVVKSILFGDESSGGGSTITQQLVKNLYPRQDYGWLYYPVNKMREMIVAKKIEKLYTKKEIISLYLNTVSFGLDLFGVESASQRFFNKSAKEINWQEAAALVGMLKATTYYNPLVNPIKSRERRDFVLAYLKDQSILEEQQADSLQDTEFVTAELSINKSEYGYLKEEVLKRVKNILEEDESLKDYDLYSDGLKIYTTIDLQLQEFSEAAVEEHLSALQELLNKQLNENFWLQNSDILEAELKKVGKQSKTKADLSPVFSYKEGIESKELSTIDSIKYHLSFLQTGLLSSEPESGKIKTWVGGINHTFFPYDHIKSKRQVGSTIKPFIYATALEQRVDPCTYFETEAVSYEVDGETWKPENAGAETEEEKEGKMTMQMALQNSVNTVAVKILREAGIKNVSNKLKQASISSDIPEVPSLALGTAEVSLYEMVQAFSVFANQGLLKPLYLIERIENKEGELIYQHKEEKARRVFSEKNTAIIRHFLENAVNDGTGSRLRSTYGLRNDIAGKTGTTQNGSDGWFIGFTPDLITGSWVGGNYPNIRFQTGNYGQGSRMALPLWGLLHQKIAYSANHKYILNSSFSNLPKDIERELSCDPFKKEFKLFQWLFGNDKETANDKVVWNTDSTSVEKTPKQGFLNKVKSIFKRN